jgi:glucan 1,3-beta-glucosidase
MNTSENIRGVNLGGWLLLEPWITPSLFKMAPGSVDEWTLSEQLGKNRTFELLEPHWRDFITYEDLVTIRNAGITHLRIPFGYWMIDIEDNEPYVSGQLPYIYRVLDWAKQIGLKVWLDLHGAPGAQNTFDNSGRRDSMHWADPKPNVSVPVPTSPESVNLRDYPNIERTLRILGAITHLFSSPKWNGVITGICVMNEPIWTIPIPIIKAFYYAAYDLIHAQMPNWTIILSDSFRLNEFTDFMPPPLFSNVILDTHIYHVFDQYLLGLNEDDHCSHPWNVDVPRLKTPILPVIVGEWSLATTDCAFWLNGVGRGTRWEGFDHNLHYITFV